MSTRFLYKIRNKNTGLFSAGGSIIRHTNDVRWSKQGKVWTTIGGLKLHLNQHYPTKYNKGTDMTDWEVVEYKIEEVSVKGTHEYMNPKKLIALITK